jgi:hypothetical protein
LENLCEFAQVLIGIARPLHAQDPIGVDLDQSLYAPDSTTIDLCLSLFPWAKCRRRKAAVKMHTLLDLHGNISTFIHVTSGDVHDVNILDEIAIVGKRPGLAASLYQTLQILSVTLFENPHFMRPSDLRGRCRIRRGR